MANRLDFYSPSGQRIYEIIQHYGLNKTSFSAKLGMKDNSLIVRVINDPNRSFTVDLIQRIALNFPEVNIRWLVTGEGPMLCNMPVFPDPKFHYIEYYRKDGKEPVDLMRIYGYEDCDRAFDVYGDIMAPKFRSGDVIICKTIPYPGSIAYGEAFLIILNNEIPLIRYIRSEIDTDSIKLGAENPRHEDSVIRKADITRLYIIKGVVRRESF